LKPIISKDATVGSFFWLWPLFCFQAGLINSGGFLACHRFVSHITGFGTRIGAEFINKNILLGFEMLTIPIGFILGCFVAGYYSEIKDKKFALPLLMMSGILILITIFGSLNYFGPFGEPLILERDFFLLFLLCFSCGLQNSLLTSITGGIVRTTHMTGVATDLGLSLVRCLKKEDPTANTWLKFRLYKITLFGFGATTGALLFNELNYLGFLIPAVMNLILLYFLNQKILRAGLL